MHWFYSILSRKLQRKSDKEEIRLEISSNSFRQRKEWGWVSYSLDGVSKQGANSDKSVTRANARLALVHVARVTQAETQLHCSPQGKQVKRQTGLLGCQI